MKNDTGLINDERVWISWTKTKQTRSIVAGTEHLTICPENNHLRCNTTWLTCLGRCLREFSRCQSEIFRPSKRLRCTQTGLIPDYSIHRWRRRPERENQSIGRDGGTLAPASVKPENVRSPPRQRWTPLRNRAREPSRATSEIFAYFVLTATAKQTKEADAMKGCARVDLGWRARKSHSYNWDDNSARLTSLFARKSDFTRCRGVCLDLCISYVTRPTVFVRSLFFFAEMNVSHSRIDTHTETNKWIVDRRERYVIRYNVLTHSIINSNANISLTNSNTT